MRWKQAPRLMSSPHLVWDGAAKPEHSCDEKSDDRDDGTSENSCEAHHLDDPQLAYSGALLGQNDLRLPLTKAGELVGPASRSPWVRRLPPHPIDPLRCLQPVQDRIQRTTLDPRGLQKLIAIPLPCGVGQEILKHPDGWPSNPHAPKNDRTLHMMT